MADQGIRCWGGAEHGSRSRCEATIPDSEFATMTRHGWGFLYAFDPGMPEGIPGAYYACPNCKDPHFSCDAVSLGCVQQEEGKMASRRSAREQELHVETEQLRADRDNSNRLLDDCRRERNTLQKICAERADEIDRLRAVLIAIVEQDQEYDDGIKGPTHDGYIAAIAREALRRAPAPTSP